jgi:hypothetical protein
MTIKVPKATRDRLHRLAASDGLTLAQEINQLIDRHTPRLKPSVGGFRSSRAMSTEENDVGLGRGFGE